MDPRSALDAFEKLDLDALFQVGVVPFDSLRDRLVSIGHKSIAQIEAERKAGSEAGRSNDPLRESVKQARSKRSGANSPLAIEADGYGLFGAKMGAKENQGKTSMLLAV